MSDTGTSVTDIAGISKSVEKIVDWGKSFTDLYTKPALVERLAAAKMKAARSNSQKMKIIAEAETEVARVRAEAKEALRLSTQGRGEHLGIVARGEATRKSLEVCRQRNLECIVYKALGLLHQILPQQGAGDDSAVPSEDWLACFIGHAQSFSDDDMQNLWAKILSGEFEIPGSFSKRMLRIISELEKNDAELFNTLSLFVWHSESTGQPELILPDTKFILGITFEKLERLGSIGLIHVPLFQDSTKCDDLIYGSYKLPVKEKGYTTFSRLSQAGKELISISRCPPNKEVLSYTLKMLDIASS